MKNRGKIGEAVIRS